MEGVDGHMLDVNIARIVRGEEILGSLELVVKGEIFRAVRDV